MSTATADIERAILDLIAEQAVLGNLPLPTTTLSAAAHAGDTSLSFAPQLLTNGASRILEGAMPWFYDGVIEMPPALATVAADGTGATLDTTASIFVPSTGALTADHENETPIVFNLADFPPWDMSGLLQLGDPLVFVTATERRDQIVAAPGGYLDAYSVHIQVNRRFDRPDDTVNPETWARFVDKTSKADCQVIGNALEANESLATAFADPIAIQFGRLGSGDKVAYTFGPSPMKKDGSAWAYAGVIQLTVLCAG